MAVRFRILQRFTKCFPWAGAVTITAALVAILWQPFSHFGGGSRRARPASSTATEAKPPWIYGRPDARFTIVAYADFACPYCRHYIPILQRWIDEHADVNLQWRHLPLAAHGGEAMRLAQLAECAGMTYGNAAFWRWVQWVWQPPPQTHSRAPFDPAPPERSENLQTCLRSTQADLRIQEDLDAAARAHVEATPTLALTDTRTGKTLTLQGMIEGDALLSAFDGLIAPCAEP